MFDSFFVQFYIWLHPFFFFEKKKSIVYVTRGHTLFGMHFCSQNTHNSTGFFFWGGGGKKNLSLSSFFFSFSLSLSFLLLLLCMVYW